MPAKRKLFLTHAGELAHLLVRAVERDGLVAELLRGYAERYGRRKLIADPARIHELERTIGREALLVIVTEVRRLLPRAFATGKSGALKADEAALCDAFYAEFLASLERALEWPPAEAETEAASFQRDLGMYGQWSTRSAASPSAQARAAAESPFADRCAMLLDPGMMEQAHRAAAGFEVTLARAGGRILGQLGRPPMRASAKRGKSRTKRARTKEKGTGGAARRREKKPAQALASRTKSSKRRTKLRKRA